jgi:RimJ/RimL family protein N-acetyltransferase
MEEKIVLEGKHNGVSYVLRYPVIEDTQELTDYLNVLSSEQTYIRLQGETVTFAEEKEYMEKNIEQIKNKKSVKLLLYVDGKLHGIAGVDLKDKIQSHIGDFGITLRSEVRGMGFGRMLMKATLKEAILNLPHLRIIDLSVFATNKPAYALYKSLGFQEYGRLPEGLSRRGVFVDQILMYKSVV